MVSEFVSALPVFELRMAKLAATADAFAKSRRDMGFFSFSRMIFLLCSNARTRLPRLLWRCVVI